MKPQSCRYNEVSKLSKSCAFISDYVKRAEKRFLLFVFKMRLAVLSGIENYVGRGKKGIVDVNGHISCPDDDANRNLNYKNQRSFFKEKRKKFRFKLREVLLAYMNFDDVVYTIYTYIMSIFRHWS